MLPERLHVSRDEEDKEEDEESGHDDDEEDVDDISGVSDRSSGLEAPPDPVMQVNKVWIFVHDVGDYPRHLEH